MNEDLKYLPAKEEMIEARTVNPDQLEQLMPKQVADFAVASYRLSLAHKQTQMIDLELETLQARLYRMYRNKIIEKGDKPTEKLIDSYIKANEKYIELSQKLFDAETIESINKGIVSALVQRKDIIVQMAVNRREEIKSRITFTN